MSRPPSPRVTRGPSKFSTDLVGYEEVPAVSTAGGGMLPGGISKPGDEIRWELNYDGLRGVAQQAHIHFGQTSVNGGISVFLCTDLGNGPAGTQGCPDSGKVTGTFRAADVIGPAAQGIRPASSPSWSRRCGPALPTRMSTPTSTPAARSAGSSATADRAAARVSTQPRSRSPRGVARKPASSSARPSGESSTPAPSARSTVSRPS